MMIRKYDNPNEALRATLGNLLWIVKNLDENIYDYERDKRKELLHELRIYKSELARIASGINHDLEIFENHCEDFK